MLNEYLNEIIAGIAIITTVVIFLIVKIKTTQTSKTNDEEQVLEFEYKTEHKHEKELIEEETTNQNDEPEDEMIEVGFSGSEEGDFGEEIESQETPLEETPSQHIITRRDVPSHAKITKQNFCEFSGERILVAEDNLINQKVLTGLLAGSGIEVIIANDGQEALDILENDSDFLMILMDAHMPRVDGFEATRAIRKEEKYNHILIVALSGDTAADDIRKMTEAGMAEHLEKPLRMETLYDIFYAYTGQDKTEEESDYIEVVMTKELNGDKGLEVCGGDEEFYREILSEFIHTYENSTQELGELLQNEELDKAGKLLLDVIGITANIGADQLNAIAMDIKNSLSDTQEKSYLTLADQYKTHLENLIKDIKEYM